jgi:uncharacterized membrane protein
MMVIVIVVSCFVGAMLLVFAVGLLLANARVGPWRAGLARSAEVREAAARDAAVVLEDRKLVRPDAPGADPDEL